MELIIGAIAFVAMFAAATFFALFAALWVIANYF